MVCDLTEAEISQLLVAAAADQHAQIYAFVFIALHTAMHAAGEILSMRHENVDLDKLLIHLPKAKAGSRCSNLSGPEGVSPRLPASA